MVGLLAAVPLVALAGCSSLPDLSAVRVDPDWPGTADPPVPDADERARARAADDARTLRRAADAFLAAGAEGAPAAAAALLVAAGAEHLAALGEPVDGPVTGGPTSTPTAPPAPSAAALAEQVAGAAEAARADVPGTSAGLARLLASVAASRSLLAQRVSGAPEVPDPSAVTGAGPAGSVTGTVLTPPQAVPGEAAALEGLAAGALAAARGVEVAAASLADDARARALDLRGALEAEADVVAAALVAVGGRAPVAAPDYVLPAPLGGADDAVALVTLVLDRLAATALDAVPALVGERRLVAADTTVRAAAWADAWRPGGPADDVHLALPGTTAPA